MMIDRENFAIDCNKCNGCGNITFSEKKRCPKCGGADIGVVQSSGTGRIVEYASIHYPTEEYQDLAPFSSVLVQLDNGCSLFGIVQGELEMAAAGSLVRAVRRDERTGAFIFQLN